VLEKAKQAGYAVLVTADHGNLEVMRTQEGKPHVAHTANLVECIAVADGAHANRRMGRLCDVAPTVLAAMGVERPADMTGESLFTFAKRASKVLLIILDGWGIGEPNEANPIYLAETPVWDALVQDHSRVAIAASGEAVGLEPGKPGNSEAGHINLGAGRVVLQDDVRLDAAMKDGSFAKNPVFLETIEGVKARGGALNLIALLTKKSSHGSIDYPLAILDIAREHKLEDVIVHIVFDGRSTEPGSAPALLREFGAQMDEKGVGLMVFGVGRGVALDRDQNWPKVKRAYDSLVSGIAARYRD
jgi:2,3-bisphosphoglycerate-independent phosphoglycerate mutase